MTDLLLPGQVADPFDEVPRPMLIADDVHINYQVYASGKRMSARESMMSLRSLRGGRDLQTVPALRGVSFTANEGESIGVVGHNGSGKSTLFRAMTGLIPPSEGAIYARDRPVLLGVNAALVPELSGENNIRLGLLAMGFDPEEAAARVDEIADFAELNDFIYHPMRTYSSGMAARLKFAIASAKAHSILLIDEALAVGDRRFRTKSEKRINELRDSAGLVMIVSHSVGSLKETCERVLWVHKGELIADGPADDVIDEYMAWTKNPGSNAVGAASAAKPSTKNAPVAVPLEPRPAEDDDPLAILMPEAAHAIAVPTPSEQGSRAHARRVRHRRAEERKQKRSMLLMVLTGLAVLLAVAAGAIIGTLSSVAAPVEFEPSARPEPSATAAAAAPVIKSFTVNTPTLECATEETEAQVLLGWEIEDAKSVALGLSDVQVDALDAPFAAALPAKLTDRPVPFPCTAPTVVYTVTAENADGTRASAAVTVTRVLLGEPEEEETEPDRDSRSEPTQPDPDADSGAAADAGADGGAGAGADASGTADAAGTADAGGVDGTADAGGVDGTADAGGVDGTADAGGVDGTADAGGVDGTADSAGTADASGTATASGGAAATGDAGGIITPPPIFP